VFGTSWYEDVAKGNFVTMSRIFKTVDLFAGPGGLAEGFSSIRKGGRPVFDIALSVEKEPSAFRTLRLRAFTRQFREMPETYYRYIAGEISREDLIAAHHAEWKAAEEETALLELGTDHAKAEIDQRLDAIRADGNDETVLIGGPPCQAYSLVGRARNRGNSAYDAAADHRHFLYREYIRILDRLRPAAFVMENVKGILSSKVEGEGIFEKVLADLRNAGGEPDGYTLLPLVCDGKGRHGEHIIRSELYGIPQRRHRVILVGIRSDRLAARSILMNHWLWADMATRSVADVLDGMPKLRSGLSRQADSETAWRSAVVDAFEAAARACREASSGDLGAVATALDDHRATLVAAKEKLPRSDRCVTAVRDNWLSDWLIDDRLRALPNHETRGHMVTDLARYAFAATFGELRGRSPKASEYPRALAPDHRNWESGKFADRFRVQIWNEPSTTITSHISKDGHYFIHPDPLQCRSLTVREAARLQTFPDNYFFEGNRTEQYVQVGNAVPPLLAHQIAKVVHSLLEPDIAS